VTRRSCGFYPAAKPTGVPPDGGMSSAHSRPSSKGDVSRDRRGPVPRRRIAERCCGAVFTPDGTGDRSRRGQLVRARRDGASRCSDSARNSGHKVCCWKALVAGVTAATQRATTCGRRGGFRVTAGHAGARAGVSGRVSPRLGDRALSPGRKWGHASTPDFGRIQGTSFFSETRQRRHFVC
jgi:hypothetical protein